jgi:hypothetical protein
MIVNYTTPVESALVAGSCRGQHIDFPDGADEVTVAALHGIIMLCSPDEVGLSWKAGRREGWVARGIGSLSSFG